MASDIIERWKASALSTALTIYPCQIRVHQRWGLNSNFLQLGRRSGGRPQRAVHPHAVTCQNCDTHYFSRPRTRNLPLVRRATSSATEPTHITSHFCWCVCNRERVFWCSLSVTCRPTMPCDWSHGLTAQWAVLLSASDYYTWPRCILTRTEHTSITVRLHGEAV